MELKCGLRCTPATSLPDLPADVISTIIRFMPLNAFALTRLACVCKRLRTVTKNERLWKEIVLARWPCPDLTSAAVRRMTWCARYRHFDALTRKGLPVNFTESRQRRQRKWRITPTNTMELTPILEDLDGKPVWCISKSGEPYLLSDLPSGSHHRYNYRDGFPLSSSSFSAVAQPPWSEPRSVYFTPHPGRAGGSILVAKAERREYQVIDADTDEAMLTLLDPDDGTTRQLPLPESPALAADILDGLAGGEDVSVVVEKILEEEEVISCSASP